MNPASKSFDSWGELEHFYKRLDALLKRGPVGFIGVDDDGIIRYWNENCQRILGYHADELVNKSRVDDIAGESALSIDSAEGKVLSGECVFIHKNGTPRILHRIALPFYLAEAGSKVSGYTLCLFDMTERREAEEALRRERNMMNLVLDTMGAGLVLFNAEGRAQWVNSTLTKWFGGRSEDYKGLTCQEVFHCHTKNCDQCAIGLAVDKNTTQSIEMWRTDETASRRCFAQMATPLELGRRQYLVLTLDVTEDRRRKEHLQILNELARALNRSLDPDTVQHLVLTCVTAGHALGFNRAFLFLVDQKQKYLKGSMAVGPISEQDAARIWNQVDEEVDSLDDLLAREQLAESDMELTDIVRGIQLELNDSAGFWGESMECMKTKLVNASDQNNLIEHQVIAKLDLRQFVLAPLVARNDFIGVLIADNRFSQAPIDDNLVHLVEDFAAQASLAISNARAYRNLSDKMQELENTQEKLIDAERFASVGRMAAHMAHEIRNPLATIGGFAKSIERNCEKPEIVQRNAAIVYNEALRLEGVLNDALNFTRPVKLNKEMCALNDLLREIAEEYRGQMSKKGIKFRLDLDESLPEIHADRHQIKQVLINLCHNAFEALEISPEKKFLLGSSKAQDEIIISVSDSGQGMDQETRKNIFAPFYTTKKGGSGLGLAISRKIVQEHGGDIEVESQRGKGANFYIRLPVGREQ